MPITPEQMLRARLLLGWPRARLASQSETTETFITRYENDGRVTRIMPREKSFDGLASIQQALERAGIEFTAACEPGIKLRKVDEN